MMMTSFGDVATAGRAMKAGAIDVLEKPYNDPVLLDSIEEAIKKDSDIRRWHLLSEAVRSNFSMLTPREKQVMRMVVQGHANKQIAGTLEVSAKTIEAHHAKVMRKMGAGSIAELMQLAEHCF
jgi:FixJ family two-component response regulator